MRWVLIVATLAGCEVVFPLENRAPVDGAAVSCTTDDQCPGGMPVCNANTCVTCTVDRPQACTGTAPVCAADNACHPCGAHTDCALSNACLPDGSCAAEADVAYVAPGGSGTTCTQSAPCGTVAVAVTTNLPIIKLATGLIKDTTTTTITGKTVTVLADPGAVLDCDGDGVLLRVEAGADVTVVDLQISGQTGASDSAISVVANGGTPRLTLVRTKILNNQGVGISVMGGQLAVRESTLSGNAGGGISVVNGTFEIVDNAFYNNGTQFGVVGGISITTSQNGVNRLEFNSFSQNQAQASIGCAIGCVAGTFTAKNNIMSDNATAMNSEQVSGSCTHAYSIARPGTLPAGTTNSAADPLFVDEIAGDLHIMSDSPARHFADPSSSLSGFAATDIDGQQRVSPTDIGADAVP